MSVCSIVLHFPSQYHLSIASRPDSPLSKYHLDYACAHMLSKHTPHIMHTLAFPDSGDTGRSTVVHTLQLHIDDTIVVTEC